MRRVEGLATTALDDCCSLVDDDPRLLAALARVLARRGRNERAREVLADAVRASSQATPLPELREVVAAAAALGDVDGAVALARAYAIEGEALTAMMRAQVCARARLWNEAHARADAALVPNARIEGHLDIAREAKQHGVADVVARAFDAAIAHARTMEGRDRGWRLRDIGNALVETNERDRLVAVVHEAKQVANGERSMMIQLSVLIAEAGDLRGGRAAAKRGSDWERTRAELAIAEIAQRMDRESTALEAAAHEAIRVAVTIPELSSRVSLLADVAVLLARIGDTATAARTLADAAAIAFAIDELDVGSLLGIAVKGANVPALAPIADDCRDGAVVRMARTHLEKLGDPAARGGAVWSAPGMRHLSHSIELVRSYERAGRADDADGATQAGLALLRAWRGELGVFASSLSALWAWSLTRA